MAYRATRASSAWAPPPWWRWSSAGLSSAWLEGSAALVAGLAAAAIGAVSLHYFARGVLHHDHARLRADAVITTARCRCGTWAATTATGFIPRWSWAPGWTAHAGLLGGAGDRRGGVQRSSVASRTRATTTRCCAASATTETRMVALGYPVYGLKLAGFVAAGAVAGWPAVCSPATTPSSARRSCTGRSRRCCW